MNLILLKPEDFIAPQIVKICDSRHAHIVKTLKKSEGDPCQVGEYNGLIGQGVITEMTTSYTIMQIELTQQPPTPPPITLLLALPRPKTLRKVLHCAGTLGVKRIHFFGSFKVEKSYWSSPFLEKEYLAELETLALEQCVDTLCWQIEFHRFFKPFVEDIIPQIVVDKEFLVCHPATDSWTPANYIGKECVVCFGPEGGFTDYEVGLLQKEGGKLISLGDRVLRTEVALPVLLGKLI